MIGVFVKNADPEDIKKVPIFDAETGKVEDVERIVKSDAEWKKTLTKGVGAPFNFS